MPLGNEEDQYDDVIDHLNSPDDYSEHSLKTVMI